MQAIKLPALESLLQRRYHKLVVSHMRAASPLVAARRVCPTRGRRSSLRKGLGGFTTTNESPSPLVEPLRACGAQRVAATHSPFAFLVHDWSKPALLDNLDATARTHAQDVGYERTPALLAGLGVLMPMLALLKHPDLNTLKEFIKPLAFQPSG